MTLRFHIHPAGDAEWRAKATSFAGVTTLAMTIGADEVLVFLRPDQLGAARRVADAVNAAFAAPGVRRAPGAP